jgi:hypothetical protein
MICMNVKPGLDTMLASQLLQFHYSNLIKKCSHEIFPPHFANEILTAMVITPLSPRFTIWA